MGQRMDISLSPVRRRIKLLKEQNKIERVGGDKTGYWELIE